MRVNVFGNDDRIAEKDCNHPSTTDVTADIGGGEEIVLTSLCDRCGVDC